MKKSFVIILTILMFTTLLASCVTPNNTDTSNDTEKTENENGYYSQLSVNSKYIGELPPVKKVDDEYIRVEAFGATYDKKVKTYSSYHLITTYEELCTVFPDNGVSNTIFDENYILFIKREYWEEWGEYIGFKNLSYDGLNLSITFDRYHHYYGISSPGSLTNQDYVLIPKNDIETSIASKGTIIVLENQIMLHSIYKSIEPTNSFLESEEAKMWSFYSKNEIEAFCQEKGLELNGNDLFFGENYAYVFIYVKRKGLSNDYCGYNKFELKDGVITATLHYNTEKVTETEEAYMLDLIKIPIESLNGQVLNGTPANIVVDEKAPIALPLFKD